MGAKASQEVQYNFHTPGLKGLPVWDTAFPTDSSVTSRPGLDDEGAQRINCVMKLISDGRALTWESSTIQMTPGDEVLEAAESTKNGTGNPTPRLVSRRLPVANCDGVTAAIIEAGEEGAKYNMVVLEVDEGAKMGEKCPPSVTFVGYPLPVYLRAGELAFLNPDSQSVVITSSWMHGGIRGDHFSTALEALSSQFGITPEDSKIPGCSEMETMEANMKLRNHEKEKVCGFPSKYSINHSGGFNDQVKASRDPEIGSSGLVDQGIRHILIDQGRM